MDEVSELALQAEIAELEQRLANKKRQLAALTEQSIDSAEVQISTENTLNNNSSPEEKIALFRTLFKGREDLYAKRFESKKTGKSGYQPVCKNEWERGICAKPKIKCSDCNQRSFVPVTDDVIRNHLEGHIVMGVYPMLQNETCHFLALDFDKAAWQEDARAFLNTCNLERIPAALERSRSGNGAHVWIFFDKPVPASKARKLGSFLMTCTLDRRPEIGLDSFDRFFPSQDTLPKGNFGNLIALPLQKAAREKNHSIFINNDMIPYGDQWAFLALLNRMDETRLDILIQNAIQRNELLPVTYKAVETEDDAKPWQKKSAILPAINDPLPQNVEIILADQLYINHTGLPPLLRNRILRLASFANPEFYRSQRMRLSTWDKPHILCCYEFFPEYVGLPTGCLDGLLSILEHYQIKPVLSDKQNHGQSIGVIFQGELKPEQKMAAQKLL
jgi:hypothetical protein